MLKGITPQRHCIFIQQGLQKYKTILKSKESKKIF